MQIKVLLSTRSGLVSSSIINGGSRSRCALKDVTPCILACDGCCRIFKLSLLNMF